MNKNDKIEEKFTFPRISVLGDGDRRMKIESVHIQGIGGIYDLYLEFNDGVNVICGVNGVGKSTILTSINEFFIRKTDTLRRNVNCNCGNIELKYTHNQKNIVVEHKIQAFTPQRPSIACGIHKECIDSAVYLMGFDSERDIPYCKLNEISADPDYGFYDRRNWIEYIGIKNWFINRYAFSDKDNSIDLKHKRNFEIAKENFSILDKDIKFKSVLGTQYEILVETPSGEIYFEYLSSGYKTCIYIVLGIIKEIEYRFKDPCIEADKFDGVILIDEIDLHLHPTWQAKLINSLKTVFPMAQIIATTHSPNILQCLEKDEIIALDVDEDHNVYQKDLQLGEYGLQGWTLEEILTDVMGMPSTTSELYEKTIAAFDKAMDEEDIDGIKESYDLLDKMLHPKSTLRKLLKIQMAGMEV